VLVDEGNAGGAKDRGNSFVKGQNGLVEMRYIRYLTSF
jgi:hypothetical protein